MRSLRPLEAADVERVVELSLRAWSPVFDSFRAVLGPELFLQLYPDWTSSQADAVRTACTDPGFSAWVVERDSGVAGFVSIRLDHGSREGEIHMVAVDPDLQRCGLGSSLTRFALEHMRAEGMVRASVGTGGDPGHIAARATYEKAGFAPFPLVRYYKLL